MRAATDSSLPGRECCITADSTSCTRTGAFAPVKLVFAPELHGRFLRRRSGQLHVSALRLDVAFVRAYEADSTTPRKTPHYFSGVRRAPSEGELVFVTGNPGSTSRQVTFHELMYERVIPAPFLIQLLEGQRACSAASWPGGPEAEQQVRQQLFEIENSLKAIRASSRACRTRCCSARKLRWEREFRQR